MAFTDPQLTDMLTRLTTASNPVIEESDFVRYFLPLFAAKPENGQVNINVWLDVAGSPFSAVTVMNGKEVLFEVPPLLNSDDKLLEGISGTSVYETITTAQLKYNVLPKLGDLHIRQWLTERLGSNQLTLDAVLKWNFIFKRYGLETIPIPEGSEHHADVTRTAPSVSFTEYEEL
jgi:hypothetical protein